MTEGTNLGLGQALPKDRAVTLANGPTTTSLREAARRDEMAAEERRQVQTGDVDSNGDLIESGRYTITGWRTRDEREDGEMFRSEMPSAAGVIVANLLREGYYQIIVGDQKGGS